MCEFISWKKDPNGHIYFLTDNKVFSAHGREALVGTMHNDVLGHGAIDAYYGLKTRSYTQYERKNFWDKDNYPKEIRIHLESPKTLLATWGKMLKQHLEPDDAFYILLNAPEPWKSALIGICIEHVAKNTGYACRTLLYIESLAEEQKDILVKAVARDAEYAYCTLHYVENLTEEQKKLLRELAESY